MFIAPMVALIGLLWLESTDLDRLVENWFFDPVRMNFPLRYDTFLEVVAAPLGEIRGDPVRMSRVVAAALSYLIESLKPQRRLLWFIVLSLALALQR